MNESISLYYQDGSSDKVYNASLEERDGGWVVNFSFGRRGAALNVGTKTAKPVDLATAKKAYDKLVKEKTAKGYKPSGAAPASINALVSAAEDRDTGIHPQLLNSIEENDLERLFKSQSHCLQQKYDGRRLIVKKIGKKVIGINRKGQEVALRKEIEEVLALHDGDCILDGEDCGDVYWAFDCLSRNGKDLTASGYKERWEACESLVVDFRKTSKNALKVVSLAASFWTEKEKRQAYEQVKKQNAEGVVFKIITAKYVAGRPASGGNQLKYKFVATVTCKVASRNGTKRSVALELKDGASIGNVTIPANFEIPNAGDLVEVRYLYGYKGGSLYQPVYLGVRDDIEQPDAAESLKFKPEGIDEE